MNKVYTTKNKL